MNRRSAVRSALAALAASIGITRSGLRAGAAQACVGNQPAPDGCFCVGRDAYRCPSGYAYRSGTDRCKCALRNEANCRYGRFAPKVAC